MAHFETALITGASSGLGYAIALELARSGTKSFALIARRAEPLAALAVELESLGATARVVQLDVSQHDELIESIRELDNELGGFDRRHATFAPHPRVGHRKFLQRRQSSIGTELLRGPQKRIQNHNGEDPDRLARFADDSGYNSRGHKHDDHEVAKLVREHAQRATPLPLFDLVAAEFSTSPLYLRRAKALVDLHLQTSRRLLRRDSCKKLRGTRNDSPVVHVPSH